MNAAIFGAAGFWIAVAAIVVAVIWYRSRSEQMKHETMRQIVEKTGQVDDVQLRKLLDSPDPGRNGSGIRWPEPGYGYRALRILGVLTLFAAAAIAAFTGVMAAVFSLSGGIEDPDDLAMVFAVAIGIAIIGCGLFFCSRFLPKPLPNGSARNDRN
jgi:hypothetical protein